MKLPLLVIYMKTFLFRMTCFLICYVETCKHTNNEHICIDFRTDMDQDRFLFQSVWLTR